MCSHPKLQVGKPRLRQVTGWSRTHRDKWQGLFLSRTAASLPEDASIFALRRCHTCRSPARSCSPLGAASSTTRGCLFLDGVTKTGTRVTEGKNDQSQGSHRSRCVLPALALESQWAHCPEHLSHLPMTITSAALGSRAPGSLGSPGRSQLPELMTHLWEELCWLRVAHV